MNLIGNSAPKIPDLSAGRNNRRNRGNFVKLGNKLKSKAKGVNQTMSKKAA
jgi:hypothetical protein